MIVAAAQLNDVVGGRVVHAQGCPVVLVMYLLPLPQSHQPPEFAIAAHVFWVSAACSHVGVAPPPPPPAVDAALVGNTVPVPVPLLVPEVRVYGMPVQVER